MVSIPSLPRLGSAATVFFGRQGAVSLLARQRGVSRQTLYREADGVLTAVDGSRPSPLVDRLRNELAQERARIAELERKLRHAVVIDSAKLAHFAASAQALGVTLSATHALLKVLMPARVPSVSKLGRFTQKAGRQAAAVLRILDGPSRARSRQVAADEIFAGRRPVLMTVDQESLSWLGGRLAPTRDGDEWAKEFQQLPGLEQVTRDGAQGIRKGLEQVNHQRRQARQAEILDQEDHFHLLESGRQALRTVRRKAAQALQRAEAAQAPFDRDGQAGVPRSSAQGRSLNQKWRQAEQAFDLWAAQERALHRLRAALALITPEGELNHRARAEAEVRDVLTQLSGTEWTRLRRRLSQPGVFTFLDRVHARLAEVPAPAEVRDRLVRAEMLRRRPDLTRGPGTAAVALRGVVVAAGALVAVLGEAGRLAQQAMREALRGVWRASSLVEGMNSVLRMHQARQKRLTKGLLDLKRLYWNMHEFRAGKRKGQTPYRLLGLALPKEDWWELLQKPPEQLKKKLSDLNPGI